jgi:hypothetical protein
MDIVLSRAEMERLKNIKACSWSAIEKHAGDVADVVLSAKHAGQTKVEYIGNLHDVVKSVLITNGFCVHTKNRGRTWHITWCLPAAEDEDVMSTDDDDDDEDYEDKEDEDEDEEDEGEDVPCCKKKCCPCPPFSSIQFDRHRRCHCSTHRFLYV